MDGARAPSGQAESVSDSHVEEKTADGKHPDRLIALSDGIFAIAMTLLVLDIRVPPGLDAAQFDAYLHKLLPGIAAYALSFTVLSGFWRDQRRLLRLARGFDGPTLRLALAGLGAVALLPFPTALLSQYASRPLAVVIYAATIVTIDLLHLALFLALRRRPHQAHRIPDAQARNILLDLGSSIVVFGATLPVALVSPHVALWCWLALAPLSVALGLRRRAQGAKSA
jgi:uncharacterized membrane protein